MGIRDMVKTAGSRAILAVVTPKNNEDEQALGDQLYTALGVPSKGHWSTRKPKLMGHLNQYGTQCIIVDDAYDLSLQHLMFIKEITDQGRLQYDHPLGLCLVAAARCNTIPLKETLDQPDLTWLQWRRRLDKIQPFAGHTSEEVREILATLETVHREVLPQLNLRQWTSSIYAWLTQPVLDPTHSGRVTMDYLMKLVTIALEWTYSAGETDVRAETLKEAASFSCSVEIRFESLMVQVLMIWSLTGIEQHQHVSMKRYESRKQFRKTSSSLQRKRWKRANRLTVRFLEWFPSISNEHMYMGKIS
ncbi:hypothetical protein KDA_35930 [Dictyobacter alpinus]|uniref:Uncharacterized protein n=2 Tax=Dictyobacter alpinus TaxID=2014873 RepID=A0A402B9Y7_9CHLR|nr:hypothetical protein KDA_35930 [Dictyobacter alpinus]